MTHKQSIFVAEYLKDMNATQAAIRAGYSPKTAYSIGQENLKKPEIKRAIKAAMNERKNALIANRQERQEFWTLVMRDHDTDMRQRLKASELLAKSECDFIERHEVTTSESDYDLSKLNEEELLTLNEILSKCSYRPCPM